MPTRDEQQKAEIERAARGSYATLSTAAKERASAVGVAQRIGKLILRFVGENTRNRNALKQMCSVPLSNQHSSEALGRSIREAGRAVLVEDAQRELSAINKLAEQGDNTKAATAYNEYLRNAEARATLTRALRTDADSGDVQRVTDALKKLQKEDGEPTDDDEERPRSYLAPEKA